MENSRAKARQGLAKHEQKAARASKAKGADALFESLSKLDVEGVKRALERGSDPNRAGGHGHKKYCKPALAYAAGLSMHAEHGKQGDCREICRLLIEAGADPNAASGVLGLTPLGIALGWGGWETKQDRVELALDLLMAGADPGVLDASGERADRHAPKDLLARFASMVEKKQLELSEPAPKKSRRPPSL